MTIISEVMGLGDSGNTSTSFVVGEVEVDPWSNSVKDLFLDVQETLLDSPSQFLQRLHLYSTLKTMDLPCFPDGTFSPLDAEEVLDDILDSDPPATVEDVLDEAAIVAVVTDPSRSDEIIDRFNEYLEVIASQGDLESGDSVSNAILEGLSGLFEDTDDDGILDDGYDLLGNVQIALLCLMECGEDPVIIESGLLAVGAQSGTLEQLAGQPIAIGDTGASFIFPTDISELQESLGDDTCVYTGTSFVEPTSESSIPSASLSFYTINCTTGEREEVIVTVDGEFIIVLPISDLDNEDDGCEDKTASCVSGDTLSSVTDSLGCRVIDIDDDEITCGCTHLTAFSALFVDGDGSGCGGEWEWDVLQTVAATMMAFTVVAVVVFLLVEHFFFFRVRMGAIRSKTRKRTDTL